MLFWLMFANAAIYAVLVCKIKNKTYGGVEFLTNFMSGYHLSVSSLGTFESEEGKNFLKIQWKQLVTKIILEFVVVTHHDDSDDAKYMGHRVWMSVLGSRSECPQRRFPKLPMYIIYIEGAFICDHFCLKLQREHPKLDSFGQV